MTEKISVEDLEETIKKLIKKDKRTSFCISEFGFQVDDNSEFQDILQKCEFSKMLSIKEDPDNKACYQIRLLRKRKIIEHENTLKKELESLYKMSYDANFENEKLKANIKLGELNIDNAKQLLNQEREKNYTLSKKLKIINDTINAN